MSRICLCLSGDSVEGMLEQLRENALFCSMAEIRADHLDEGEMNKVPLLIQALRREALPFLWTVRWQEEGGEFKGSEEERLQLLQKGDELGADWVDVEAVSPLAKRLKPSRALKLVSTHNFEETPEDLNRELEAIRSCHPDVMKVAYKANSVRDFRRIAELQAANAKGEIPLIAISMGEYGEASRTLFAALGLPWSYAAAGESATAPGQLSARTLKTRYRIDRADLKTKLFCVTGKPLSHSLSPELHNAVFARLHQNAMYSKIPADDFSEFLKIAEVLGVHGASVTIPHKEAAAGLAGKDSWVKGVGSANTILFPALTGGEPVAENTDIEGALSAIEERQADMKDAKVLLLGAGGVGRALAWGVCRKGWKLTITNRTKAKAQALAGELNASVADWEHRSPEGFDAVINATAVGMQPDVEETPLEFPKNWKGVAFDSVYTPPQTRFLSLAEKAGGKAVSGAGMFWRQAALQYGHWFQTSPPFDLYRESMEKLSKSSS